MWASIGIELSVRSIRCSQLRSFAAHDRTFHKVSVNTHKYTYFNILLVGQCILYTSYSFSTFSTALKPFHFRYDQIFNRTKKTIQLITLKDSFTSLIFSVFFNAFPWSYAALDFYRTKCKTVPCWLINFMFSNKWAKEVQTKKQWPNGSMNSTHTQHNWKRMFGSKNEKECGENTNETLCTVWNISTAPFRSLSQLYRERKLIRIAFESIRFESIRFDSISFTGLNFCLNLKNGKLFVGFLCSFWFRYFSLELCVQYKCIHSDSRYFFIEMLSVDTTTHSYKAYPFSQFQWNGL